MSPHPQARTQKELLTTKHRHGRVYRDHGPPPTGSNPEGTPYDNAQAWPSILRSWPTTHRLEPRRNSLRQCTGMAEYMEIVVHHPQARTQKELLTTKHRHGRVYGEHGAPHTGPNPEGHPYDKAQACRRIDRRWCT